eukprot:1401583-Heterocapsa_arctica.AAC.1
MSAGNPRANNCVSAMQNESLMIHFNKELIEREKEIEKEREREREREIERECARLKGRRRAPAPK